MARARWTGSLSFGLVNVPVALYSAVRDVDLHFHQLHAKDAVSDEWDPSAFEDCYRARLEQVVARKRKGRRIAAPEPAKEPSPAPDLMAALERSLAEATGQEGSASGKDGAGLDDLSREELYERAQKRDVAGRSSMSKDELVKALAD
jgi:DNA end-binding protein Ku